MVTSDEGVLTDEQFHRLAQDGVEERAEEGGRRDEVGCRGVFCFIGATPESGWMTGLDRDDKGFVRTETADSFLPFQTSARRLFAVGDLRPGSIKRVATAVGEGASAVSSVHAVLAAG
jgi:thioredoxin reductase (NADPH)